MYIESVQNLDSLKSQFNAKDVKKKELGKYFDIKCLNELEMKGPHANTSKETRLEIEQMNKMIKIYLMSRRKSIMIQMKIQHTISKNTWKIMT